MDTELFEQRLIALEKEVAAAKAGQRRLNTAYTLIKRRLDEADTKLNEANSRLAKIGDGLNRLGAQFTDGLLQSSSSFQEIVGMNNEQAAVIGEQGRALAGIDRRLDHIEQWKITITRATSNEPAVSIAEQDSTTIKLAARGLDQHFGLDGLDELIFAVFGVQAEPKEFGDTKRLKIWNMLKRAAEQGEGDEMVWKLINIAKERRPNGLWPMDTGPL